MSVASSISSVKTIGKDESHKNKIVLDLLLLDLSL